MLTELKNTRQIPGESFRRWFSGHHIDLIVWYNDDRSSIKGFQLCYQKGKEEKAITWVQHKGYSHTTVDDGEGQQDRYKMTPILMPDGVFHSQRVIDLLHANSVHLEQEMVEFISQKLRVCPPQVK